MTGIASVSCLLLSTAGGGGSEEVCWWWWLLLLMDRSWAGEEEEGCDGEWQKRKKRMQRKEPTTMALVRRPGLTSMSFEWIWKKKEWQEEAGPWAVKRKGRCSRLIRSSRSYKHTIKLWPDPSPPMLFLSLYEWWANPLSFDKLHHIGSKRYSL